MIYHLEVRYHMREYRHVDNQIYIVCDVDTEADALNRVWNELDDDISEIHIRESDLKVRHD